MIGSVATRNGYLKRIKKLSSIAPTMRSECRSLILVGFNLTGLDISSEAFLSADLPSSAFFSLVLKALLLGCASSVKGAALTKALDLAAMALSESEFLYSVCNAISSFSS